MAGATIHVTGPATIYADGDFLGYCEVSPELDHVPAYGSIMSDVGGHVAPIERPFAGGRAFIRLTMTLWDWDTFTDNVMTVPSSNTAGVIKPSGIGSLMVAGEFTFPMTVIFPYAVGTSGTKGYNFPTSYLVSAKLHECGTMGAKLSLVLGALPDVNDDGSAILYKDLQGGGLSGQVAGPWVTGPAHLFIGQQLAGGTGFSPVTNKYLGTAERSPELTFTMFYRDVYSDLGGHETPTDLLFEGAEALVSYRLTRWDESVYRTVANWASGTARGQWDGSAIGRYSFNGGLNQGRPNQSPLSFATCTSFSAGDKHIPAGFRFPTCLLDSEQLTRMGTMGRMLDLRFRAHASYQPDGSFLLFDQSGAGLPPPT